MADIHHPPVPPIKQISWSAFRRLCWIQCTTAESANILDVSLSTLRKKCKEQYNKPLEEVVAIYGEGGRQSLRKRMWENAIDTNNTVMQILLAKQYLGMADKTKIQGNTKKPMTFRFIEKKKE